MRTPSEVVQGFVDAVIRRDLGALAASFSPDAIFSESYSASPLFPRNSEGVVATGRDQIRAIYESALTTFAGVEVEVVHRYATGKVVVDHETASGGALTEPMHSVWIYTVDDGLIQTMHVVLA